jgi:hypothetical protein
MADGQEGEEEESCANEEFGSGKSYLKFVKLNVSNLRKYSTEEQ